MTDRPASARVFDANAAEYDRLRRGLVPCFEAFYGTALDLIDDWNAQRSRGQPASVLDLGAGTGLFSALLLDRMAEVRLHLLDGSDAMLAQAKARFAGQTDARYICADMAKADFGGPYDLVISALAIHHLDDPDKQAVFARINRALNPGGLFVNAEQVRGPTPEAEARYEAVWQAQAKARGVSEAVIEDARARMRHDRCATLEDQLAWLRQAGFSDVDCSFKAWRFAVLSGRKAKQD